eukprot:SAG31_NODE_6290_length_2082_cov_1.312153_1_plen_233_part_00
MQTASGARAQKKKAIHELLAGSSNGAEKIVAQQKAGQKLGQMRTSKSATGLDFMVRESAVRAILQRAVGLLNVSGARIDDFDMQLVNYGHGQHYMFHHDTADPRIERYATLLLYLNSAPENAATDYHQSCSLREPAESQHLSALQPFCGGETSLPMATPVRSASEPRESTKHCYEECTIESVSPDTKFSELGERKPNGSAAAGTMATARNDAARRCRHCLHHVEDEVCRSVF